ncbi:MAG: hypothetical protein H0U74_03330 [Bradymonadaceae bacterium]|nr:hypothetical protein [Lujinxingiaceae bacterium]
MSKELQRLSERWSEKTGVDLTRYRSDALIEHVEHMFSLVRIMPLMGAGIATVWAVGLTAWFAFFYGALSTPFLLIMLAYVLITGWLLGGLLGLTFVVRRIMAHISAIIDLTLQTVQEIARDVNATSRDGERSRIALVELFQAALLVVIVPAIKVVIAAKVGVLRRPVTWVIERVLRRAGRLVTRTISRAFRRSAKDRLDDPDNDDALVHTPDALVRIADGAQKTNAFLDIARARVQKTSRRVQSFALFPLYLALAGGATLAALPLVLVYLLLV